MAVLLQKLKCYFLFGFLTLLIAGCNAPAKKINGDAKKAEALYKELIDLVVNSDKAEIREHCKDYQARISKLNGKIPTLRTYAAKASCAWQSNKYEPALKNFKKVVDLADSTDQVENRIRFEALFNIADIHYEQNNLEQAYPYYLKLVHQSTDIFDPFLIGMMHKRLGLIYYNQRNPQFAREEFKNAITWLNQAETDHFYGIQEQIDNIGLCYYMEHDYQNALTYFDSTLSYIKNHKQYIKGEEAYRAAVSVAEGNKAKALLNLGELAESQALLRKNFNIKMNTKRYKDNAANDYYYLTLAKIKQKQPRADLFLDTLEQLANELNLTDLKKRIPYLRGLYYDYTQPEKVAEQFVKYTNYSDSLYRELTEGNFKLQVNKQTTEEAQSRMKLLEAEKEYNSNLALIYLLVFGFCFVILVIAVFLAYNYRKNNRKLEALNARTLNQKEVINRAAKKLQKANHELQSLNIQKSGILSVVAHDLKNPIDAIISTIEFIKSEESMDEVERNELLDLIKLSSENAESVINELVVYAQMNQQDDSSKWIEPKPVNVKEMINHAVLINKIPAREKDVVIDIECDGNITWPMDKDKMIRVISNLLNNSIKFSYSGSSISISATTHKKNLFLKITDSGIGIPEELQSKLFEPFSPSKRTGTSGERSTGLGLSIVKMIVNSHGGTIDVESNPNSGTTFIIKIPYKKG